MNRSKFYLIISLLTLIITLFGATFSFFNTMIKSDDSVVVSEAAFFKIRLSVLPLYDDRKLLPLNNSDVFKAFDNQCIDDIGNGACVAYSIEVTNEGNETEYYGDIIFNLNGVKNLNYLVLNEDNSVYQDITTVIGNVPLYLGNQFNLLSGESRKFIILIWVPNFDRPQESEDASGSFKASVTYSSFAGPKVTGTFSH